MTDCTKGHETQCRQAKGLPSDCECRCGGKNHGVDRDGPRFEQTTAPLRPHPSSRDEFRILFCRCGHLKDAHDQGTTSWPCAVDGCACRRFRFDRGASQ